MDLRKRQEMDTETFVFVADAFATVSAAAFVAATAFASAACSDLWFREGSKPLRWDRTGQVVERMENRQYMVKCDGSGRVLLRSRGHLRKIQPSARDKRLYDMDPKG